MVVIAATVIVRASSTFQSILPYAPHINNACSETRGSDGMGWEGKEKRGKDGWRVGEVNPLDVIVIFICTNGLPHTTIVTYTCMPTLFY